MSRNVCVVSGSRAEYGLLRWIMEDIQTSPDLDLQVLVTCMHLSPEFGLTYTDIEADGFTIHHKVEMLLSADTPTGIAKSMGLGMIGFSDALEVLAPDLLLVLGDRFETMACVAAAMVARVPVAHLQGGELSEGAIDDAIRHSITKMSQVHLVAAEGYRRRVVQLGEHPNTVHLVGGPSLDSFHRLELLDRRTLEESLDFRFGPRNLLVTFHPVTLEVATAAVQMEEILAALDSLEDTHIIFTMPNADMEGRALFDLIQDFVVDRPQCSVYTSLGQLRYLSTVAQVDAVVGNSSSGLTEVPSLGIGTVNIGDRQRGRLKAASVVDCDPDRQSISAALAHIQTEEFRSVLATSSNPYDPYGDGQTSRRVVEVLRTVDLSGVLKKRFLDIPAA